MKKLNESAWGEMRKRSSGDVTRKEDDIVTYDGPQMSEYIYKHYRINDARHQTRYNKTDHILFVPINLWEKKDDSVPGKLFQIDNIFYDYEENVIYVSNSMYKDIYQKIQDSPLFSTEIYDYDFLSISPKKGDVNNRFLLDLIDFVIDNTPYNIHLLDKKSVNESAWGDMRKRSAGDIVRKEDDIMLMDIDRLYGYIESKYKDRVKYIEKDSWGTGDYIRVDIFNHVSLYLRFLRDTGEIQDILLSWGIVHIRAPFLDDLGERFKVESPMPLRRNITEKDGSCTNQTFIDVLDFFLDNKNQVLIECVTESAWGDMRKRSSGDAIRKEDDVNHFDVKEFYDYLMSKYTEKVHWMDIDNYHMSDLKFNVVEVKDIVIDPCKNVSIYVFYKNSQEIRKICLVYRNGKFDFTILKNNFNFHLNYFEDKYEITGKDGEINNQTVINLLDIFIENKDKIVLNESAWGEMRRRSSGEQTRKEDDIDLLDIPDFCEYLRTLYKVTDKDDIGLMNEWLCVCLYEDTAGYHRYLFYDGVTVSTQMDVFRVLGGLPELKSKYSTEEYENDFGVKSINIFPKDKARVNVTNKFFIEVLDFLLGLAKDQPINIQIEKIKDMNESAWGDMRKRSSGESVRKEDEIPQEFQKPLAVYIDMFAAIAFTGEYTVGSYPDFRAFIRDVGIPKRLSGLDFDMNELLDYITKDRYYDIIHPVVLDTIDKLNKHINVAVDSIIDSLKNPEVNESAWGDMRKRSSGEQIRKEDEMNTDNFIMLRETAKMFRNVLKRSVHEPWADTCDYFIDFIHLRKKEHFWNDTTDETYDKVIKFVKDNWGDCTGIQDFMDKYLSNINESAWGDMRKRSSGSEMRKEDEVLTDMEINSLNQFTLMYCREERVHYIQNHIVPPPPSGRKKNDYEGLIKYIEDRRDENMFTNVGDYNKIIRFIKKNWDKLNMDKYIKKYIFSPDMMKGTKIVECEGVPGGLTPADVGGMGAAYFPGPNGEPGSGDLPSPTGIVYHQVAPYTMFLKDLKKKKKKKKFRIEDEPCAHSKNPKVYDYVDDFREYVDRTYNNIDRRK